MNTIKAIAYVLMSILATLVIAVGVGVYVGLAVTSFNVGWGVGYFPNAGTNDANRN